LTPARVFRDFRYRTLESWSRRRRVVGKAEHNQDGANPRFVVTSLARSRYAARALYEVLYRARGEAENRIGEQFELFADRASSATMPANQLRTGGLLMSVVAREEKGAFHGPNLGRRKLSLRRLVRNTLVLSI
jgi:Transposase DDE domain group 1